MPLEAARSRAAINEWRRANREQVNAQQVTRVRARHADPVLRERDRAALRQRKRRLRAERRAEASEQHAASASG